ncbi:MAG: cupin domain-containing protein [Myxococcota bacterium]
MNPVASLAHVAPIRNDRPGYHSLRRSLAGSAGGRELGCSHMVVAPGSAAWPLHWHAANEEGIFILSGHGKVQRGEASFTVAPGDYVAFPRGPHAAHQVRNHGSSDLVYL